MSLRQALKSKFRPDKSESEKDLDLSSSILQTFQEEEHLLDDIPEDCPHPEKDYSDGSCKACYELQLAQLQEQLVGVMLENQQLVNEIKELKNQTVSDQLLKQLEKEKEKSRLLAEKLHERESISSKSPRLRRFVRKEKHAVDKCRLSEGSEVPGISVISEKDETIDSTKEILEDEKEQQTESPVQPEPVILVAETHKGWYSRLRYFIMSYFTELMEDFTDNTVDDEDSAEEDPEGDALTVRKLKENLVRFSCATKPVSNLTNNIMALLRWNSPGTTLLAFCVYMYTVYHGWLLPLLLFLAVCQLLLNYIRGWFSGPRPTRKHDEEGDMGVSDKFQLVLHVARKVQNQLGYMANCLEKIKNLMLWQQADVTAHLFFVLLAAFLLSCVFPSSQLFTVAGLYMGVKLFIIDYIFYRFPRVQQKHDTTARMWRSLPTDAQLERKHNRAELDKLVVNQTPGGSASLTTGNQSFCELFNLPPSETPLPAWQAGRRCTLINKDKSLTAAFKNGRLYLTNSFLCFERSKSFTPKNLVLPLKNISKVEKAKPYPWLPGGGMAIEVSMDKSDKAYIFAAILNRDETLDSIIDAGHKAGLFWATSTHVQDHEDPMPTTSVVKKTT